MVVTEIETSSGKFIAIFSERGLAQLDFPNSNRTKQLDGNGCGPKDFQAWKALTTKALRKALGGKRPEALPPLDLSCGTAFQRRVWSALRKISAGQTRSYSEIAAAIGRPKATRAVGSACGKNPIPVFVPCHRVLAANKKIGGFSGGLNWKRALLACEGIKFP